MNHMIKVMVVLFIGWVINIIQIVNTFTTISEIDIVVILRIVGIVVAPLGTVMGFFVW